MSSVKYGDTTTLVRLIIDGDKNKFNRQLDFDAVMKDVDPDGLHIFQLMLFNHERGISDDVYHHRVKCLIKLKNTMDPAEAWMDVSNYNWETLSSAVSEQT